MISLSLPCPWYEFSNGNKNSSIERGCPPDGRLFTTTHRVIHWVRRPHHARAGESLSIHYGQVFTHAEAMVAVGCNNVPLHSNNQYAIAFSTILFFAFSTFLLSESCADTPALVILRLIWLHFILCNHVPGRYGFSCSALPNSELSQHHLLTFCTCNLVVPRWNACLMYVVQQR